MGASSGSHLVPARTWYASWWTGPCGRPEASARGATRPAGDWAGEERVAGGVVPLLSLACVEAGLAQRHDGRETCQAPGAGEETMRGALTLGEQARRCAGAAVLLA